MLGREASVLSTSSSSSERSRESQDDEYVSDALISKSALSTLIRYLAGCSINLFLPFLNGLMLGFGELVAHEVCWQYKWFYHGSGSAHKIFPAWRKQEVKEEEVHVQESKNFKKRVTESWDNVKSKFL